MKKIKGDEKRPREIDLKIVNLKVDTKVIGCCYIRQILK